ncbi:M56 family metallopeptidase [Tundrisphaera sp. TA3]|uniref:M56 family metallopeptidase n=1 Tax=Tundrisphaera sp. TA3 TaxID=3435775 RepID=UPI003EBDA1CF
MIRFIDGTLDPFLALLAGWSIRWGLVILALAAWLRACPPRSAAVRHSLCLTALAAGLILPLAPRWAVPWPRSAMDEVRTPPPDRPAILDPGRPAPPRPMMPDARPSVITPMPIAAVPPIRPKPDVVAAPIGFGRWARLALGVAWLVGTAIALIRLAVGWRVLARLRASAEPFTIEDPTPTTRGVAVATHPAVGSPIVLGGRRPTILVPEGWAAMPEASRRACLLHEIAHLERQDDLAKLAGELIRAPFWFHPAVAWLLARLDREAELACDEAAVGRGVAPRDLAELLLAFARRPARLDPAGLAPRFFDRGTVAARIHRLLEDDMARSPLAPSKPKAFALAASLALLALLIGGAGARAIEPRPQQPAPAPATNPEPRPKPAPRSFSAIVRDDQGRPVEGATVVAATLDQHPALDSAIPIPQEVPFPRGMPQVDPEGEGFMAFGVTSVVPNFTVAESQFHDEVRTGADGVARFDREPKSGVLLVAFKEGLALTCFDLEKAEGSDSIPLTLVRPRPLVGSVVDEAGRPVAGAEVRIETIRGGVKGRRDHFPILEPFTRKTSLAARLATRTSPDGTFRFEGLPVGSEAVVSASAEGRAKATTASRADRPYVAGTAEDPARLVLAPEARVAGRVISDVPGVSVANRVVTIQWSPFSGVSSTLNRQATTDAGGRFEFRGLNDGDALLVIEDVPIDAPWTFDAAAVHLTPGQTAEPALRIGKSVEVTGRAVTTDGQPIADAMIAVRGSRNPEPMAQPIMLKTDATGTYRIRLAPGLVSASWAGGLIGFTDPVDHQPGPSTIVPEGVATFALETIRMARAAGPIRGRIVDAAGVPMGRAEVVSIRIAENHGPMQASAMADAQGRFTLPPEVTWSIPLHQPIMIRIRADGGQEFETWAVPNGRDEATIKLPTLRDAATMGPEAVGPDELAGVVIDPQGRPIEGVLADAYSWAPGHEARTGSDGLFRIKVPVRGKTEIRLTKDGYEPREFIDQPTGRKGWVVAMGNSTYFEGIVLAPDGSPVADAPIRADGGERRMAGGGRLSNCWTVGRSGPDGRYRLYVEPGVYEFELRVPGRGVARVPGQAISSDEARSLDLRLIPGVDFRARVVDDQTGEPVAGFVLPDRQSGGVAGTSDAAGLIRIADLIPGPLSFWPIRSDRYARFWSDEGADALSRFHVPGPVAFQRNLDGLNFEVRPGMGPVTIRVERPATIRGRVLDPDGKPVAGATVAPTLAGTGDTLLGDDRFRSVTDRDGRFAMALPAGKTFAYHLVAHDGKFNESRDWADGLVPPFRTEPGQVIEGMTIRLTRPATVRGRVVERGGSPVAGRQIFAIPDDLRKNRRFSPSARTDEEGRFAIRCITAGKHEFSIGMGRDTASITLAEGETREGIEVTIDPLR